MMLPVDKFVAAANLEVGNIIEQHSDFYYVSRIDHLTEEGRVAISVAPVNPTIKNPLLKTVVPWNRTFTLYR